MLRMLLVGTFITGVATLTFALMALGSLAGNIFRSNSPSVPERGQAREEGVIGRTHLTGRDREKGAYR